MLTMNRLPEDAVRDSIKTPVGTLTLVASNEGLHAIVWRGEALAALPRRGDHPVIEATKRQLTEYFAKKRQKFDLPLAPQGTAFQLAVWKELRKIPYGKTIHYGEQARRVGDPNKARAVGTANGQNPIAIVVPCPRVIAKTGGLAGFGGGIENKKLLLELEGAAGAVAQRELPL